MSRDALLPVYLEGHNLVLSAFGYWPAFHDAEVISFVMDRSQILFTPIHNARIELLIHAFEWTKATSKIDPQFNHHLVHFEFNQVSEVKLDGFNHQNALEELTFQELPLDGAGSHPLKIELQGVFGIGGEFVARQGKLLSVVPCTHEGIRR